MAVGVYGQILSRARSYGGDREYEIMMANYNAQSSVAMGIRALNLSKLGFTKHPPTATT